MLTRLNVANFRSLERCEISLGRLTVLYGATGSGKSSLLYAPLVLRNIVLNPNQATDGLFNLGFLSLGGFDACIFDHQLKRPVEVAVTSEADGVAQTYGVSLTKTQAKLRHESPNLRMEVEVALPYALNQNRAFDHRVDDTEYKVTWNGVTCAAAPTAATAETQAHAVDLTATLNGAVERVRRIDIAPHRRGFFKPSYNPVQLSPTPTSEDEVASLLISDQNLPAKVSIDLEEILDRDFRLHVVPGAAMAFFQTTEKRGSRTPVYLVNDGYGVNQVVYMLAKIHRADVDTVLIEEPEVHLHPTVVRKFARVLCRLVRDEEKQIIVATHSEHFVSAILACVVEGLVDVDDVFCYHAKRDRKSTLFERQKVDKSGQIEGGLREFVEGEMEDLRKLLALKR
ncbi:MAG: AAA family ATPase [Planctomycetota bacterium]